MKLSHRVDPRHSILEAARTRTRSYVPHLKISMQTTLGCGGAGALLPWVFFFESKGETVPHAFGRFREIEPTSASAH